MKSIKFSKRLIHTFFIRDKDLSSEKIYLKLNDKAKSYWHDLKLYENEKLNFVIEIPNQSRIIREMNKNEPLTPIMRKINKVDNKSGNKVNTRDYSKDPPMNYGFFPQTFASKDKLYRNELRGDNDPLDVIDIHGPFDKQPGEFMPVNVLGSFCLIDQGEMDWKIIVSNIKDSISSVDQEKINSIMEWFRMFKTFYGKKPNVILDNNKFFNKIETLKIIEDYFEDYKSSSYCKTHLNSHFLKNTAINFHFTRKCNYHCKFCFHTKLNSYMLPLEKQIEIIKILKEAGAEKINFAGGEPFMYPEIVGNLVKASKEMGYDSTSIISNGKLIKESWLDKYGKWLDLLGISCDTVDQEINFKIGRATSGSSHSVDETQKIKSLVKLCKDRNILFKINTVVNALNKHEDMSNFINELDPVRWKVFQVLDIEGENYKYDQPEKSKIKDLLVSNEEFHKYIERNRSGLVKKEIMVPESNELMRSSYILIDEHGRFLDTSTGGKIPTNGILEVGLDKALEELRSSTGKGFDKEAFFLRGGYYPESWTNKIK